MPRIDPHQLLSCLSILLSPEGGILSSTEVQRLANLMTKFSKKLVSKCVYVLILKNTERSLLGAFMGEGGWNLVHIWLQDAFINKNWPLVTELLQLLLITPVDVERLKMNNLPKIVKSLSRREDLPDIQVLSNQIVQMWLKIVKDETKPAVTAPVESAINGENQIETTQSNQVEVVKIEKLEVKPEPVVKVENDVMEQNMPNETDEPTKTEEDNEQETTYKLSLRDGKQVLSKVLSDETDSKADDKVDNGHQKDKKKEHSSHKSSSKHKSHSSSSKSSSSKDKSKSSSHHSTSSKDKDKSKDKSSSSHKDKSRDKDKDRKDKHKHNGSSKSSSKDGHKSSSSSSKDKKESKEKQAEKDKDTLAKIQPQSISKMGRIPKKSGDEKEEEKKDVKKPSISIEVRKNNEERPKTVKVFNSKMRSTGLLEEAKPPPPRSAVTKKPPPVIPTNLPVKRSSPIREPIPLPEKRTKLELPERPGAIKLIPPKPKPILQESDIFMDALNSAATANKKDAKKRKRRPSVNKEPTTPTETSVPNTDKNTTPPASPNSDLTGRNESNSPLGLKNIAPFNFYQDTLNTTSESENNKCSPKDNNDNEETNEAADEVTPIKKIKIDNNKSEEGKENININHSNNGLKGVLMYTKKKGPKRSIRWKDDSELVQIQYFELDETERVNVTRAFGDMARMDMTSEREAMQLYRKTPNEDLMDVQIIWKLPIEIELPDTLPEVVCRSLEKDIQFAREKSVLPALYFSRRVIPDSPAEADFENHQMTDPVVIPLDPTDETEQEEPKPVMPWPEPKGSPPPPNIPPHNIHPMIHQQQMMGGFPNHIIGGPQGPVGPFPQIGNFPPNMVQPGVPQGPHGFQNNIAPGFGGNNFLGPNMLDWNMPLMQQQPMGEHMMQPPNGMIPGSENFGGIPGDHSGFQPPHFGGGGPPHHQNQIFPPQNQGPYNNFGGRGGRGGFRRGGNNNWMRSPGPNNWNRGGGHGAGDRQGGGGANRGLRICKNVKNHGYCRNRDNCAFYHPNV